MPTDGANVARVRDAVVTYIEWHANAADTWEGIVNWWLPVEQRAFDRAVIERALEILVAEGLLEGAHLGGGAVIYRRAEAP